MKPKWQKLASLAQEICTLSFQFFSAVFASKGYTLKNIFPPFWSERNALSHLFLLNSIIFTYRGPIITFIN